MLQAGQVEIVAIVMPLIFGQSLLILCGYFTNIFEIREHLKLCFVVLLYLKCHLPNLTRFSNHQCVCFC